MPGFTQRSMAVAVSAASLLVLALSGCGEKSEIAAVEDKVQVPAKTTERAPATEAVRGTYAELAVRKGGTLGEDGKLSGGEYVPVTTMQLPSDHQIGNRLFKYEGPGWESEQVAYRLYFDERAAIDIFGKTKPQLVLPQVGQDGTDYHALADWGMDVLKVGPSLGIGGVGLWHEGKLEGVRQFAGASLDVFNEATASGVHLHYRGWIAADTERDLEMTLSIAPGSRLTQVLAQSEAPVETWATGIVRHGLEPLVSTDTNQQWGYLATWGEQSLANDNLGMAIFFRNADLQNITDDAHNHLVLLKGGDRARYQFAAVWRDDDIQTREQFIAYLEQTSAALGEDAAFVQASE
ncbi:DUF4861 family protein [Microbulbifer sp. YPW1]|uniref:DUF4861 family protein n=1 Tax=Microbulbifer sp. YPW1 TaxID=2745199 RepID=UPI001597F551|nr:DUF4861 family protein [Microbulbifer sp. YPW1]QKX16993.1 DUF4861 family protein [Microbulbifer sp. YPW1]